MGRRGWRRLIPARRIPTFDLVLIQTNTATFGATLLICRHSQQSHNRTDLQSMPITICCLCEVSLLPFKVFRLTSVINLDRICPPQDDYQSRLRTSLCKFFDHMVPRNYRDRPLSMWWLLLLPIVAAGPSQRGKCSLECFVRCMQSGTVSF